MADKVAVLVIHGIGAQEKGFADGLVERVNARVARRADATQVVWQSVLWADVLQPRQEKFLRDLRRAEGNDIDFIKLREFVISNIADAAAYQNIRGRKTSAYAEIHSRVKASLRELYREKLGGQACPLIVAAHSLGGHIMSNYIWDAQQSKARLNAFEKMEHLAGMFTFGCNIPLFSFALDKMEPIRFPGKALSRRERARAKWLNLYDADDVLGYPLGQINARYARLVEDKAVNSGNFLTSWNPLSHNGYWEDKDVVRPLAGMITDFLP